MLSQGRIDVDNIYSLNDGLLRLSLHKETYEKAGLVGQHTRFGNATAKYRHKTVVEINLRDPAILDGKNNFERITWSFTNVLKEPVNFLFCDLNQNKISSQSPCPILEAFSTFSREIQTPQIISQQVLVPNFFPPVGSKITGGGKSQEAEYQREVWREWALHVHEWLALTLLGPADRIKWNDSVDPYLSTYSVDQDDLRGGEEGITRLTFRGMIPAPWISEIWKVICCTLSSSTGIVKVWAALSVHGFENSPISWSNSAHGSLTGGENGFTILRLPVSEEGEGVGDDTYMIYKVLGSQDEYS